MVRNPLQPSSPMCYDTWKIGNDQICNSPYCKPYNSYNVSSRNFLLDQLIIRRLIFFSILSTHLVDIVLIL